MNQIIAGLALTLLFPATGLAQEVKIPDRIEKLAAAANETINITLDGSLNPTSIQGGAKLVVGMDLNDAVDEAYAHHANLAVDPGSLAGGS